MHEHGDSLSKYLSHLIKIKRDSQEIPSVLDGNGTRHFDKKNMKSESESGQSGILFRETNPSNHLWFPKMWSKRSYLQGGGLVGA